MKNPITLKVLVSVPVEKVWELWNSPTHIPHWYFASDDWCAPRAEVHLKPLGRFKIRMETKDGSIGFYFEGTYTGIEENKLLEMDLLDGRQVKIEFISKDNSTEIVETFEPENENAFDIQRHGWEAILLNFKKYAESLYSANVKDFSDSESN